MDGVRGDMQYAACGLWHGLPPAPSERCTPDTSVSTLAAPGLPKTNSHVIRVGPAGCALPPPRDAILVRPLFANQP